ncbi:hypothetical protein QOZ80_7AG0559480 [Eleusine coracana subsp. coracana]|nr:hypothetical protein QOZ80_7AG0559480 [Eleusine coracana subsp. coracana]
MALDPLFTVTFDVNSSDNYGQFISNLRHRLANPRHFTHKRPVLPPVEPNVPPRRWFHIVLRTQQAELTLATRADNLYLEGFQSTDGTWWELTDGIIPGATYTRLGGSNYGDLIRDTVELSEVALGPQQMAEAMNVLAGRVPADMSSGPAQQQAEDALVALLLMTGRRVGNTSIKPTVVDNISPGPEDNEDESTGPEICSLLSPTIENHESSDESNDESDVESDDGAIYDVDLLRHDPGLRPSISDYDVNERNAPTNPGSVTGHAVRDAVGVRGGPDAPEAAMRSGTLTDEMRELINGWKDLSAALLTADVTPPGRFTPLEKMGVYTVEQAANTVGILLFVQVPGRLTADAALKLFREG